MPPPSFDRVVAFRLCLVEQFLNLFRCCSVGALEKVAVYIGCGAGSCVTCSACYRHRRDVCCDLHSDIGAPQRVPFIMSAIIFDPPKDPRFPGEGLYLHIIVDLPKFPSPPNLLKHGENA